MDLIKWKDQNMLPKSELHFHNREGISRTLDELNISIKLARVGDFLPL